MTREELRDYVEEQRSLNNIPYHVYSTLIDGVDTLEQEPTSFQWCDTCKEYDQEKHCCHRWSKVIRDTVQEMKQEQEPILDKIRAEILEEKEHAYADFERYKVEYLGQDWEDALDSLPQDDFRYGMERAIELIDKYKAESGGRGMYIACKKCKYNYIGECDFYVMGSGNEIDMPCYREKELIKEVADSFLQAFVGAESEDKE